MNEYDNYWTKWKTAIAIWTRRKIEKQNKKTYFNNKSYFCSREFETIFILTINSKQLKLNEKEQYSIDVDGIIHVGNIFCPGT